MKVCYQPTLAEPGDRVEIDSADWHRVPKRPQPVGGEVIDDRSGYCTEVCIQGMSSTGDHHVVKDLPNGECELTSWTDDLEDDPGHPLARDDDPPEHWFHAHVIRFRPLAPDLRFGGAINTHIDRVCYGGKRFLEEWAKNGPYQDIIFRPWSEFVPPTEDVAHGIWMPDELEGLHVAARSLSGWRDWGEHLDSSELDAGGRVLSQHVQGRMSPPRGTLTQFQRDTARTTSAHVVGGAPNENTMEATAGTGETQMSANMSSGADILAYVFSSDSSFPNVADWPNGLYECQLDVTNFDTNISCGLLTLGGSVGHFANVDSGLTADNETWQQTQGAFTVAGLNLASQTIDPASGAAGDRFECLIAAARSAGCHGNRTMTLQFTSDAFCRGPWVAAVAAIPSVIMAPYLPA